MCPFDVFVNEKSIGGHNKREKTARFHPEKCSAEEKRSFALATCMRLLQQFFQFIDFPFAGLKGMIYEY